MNQQLNPARHSGESSQQYRRRRAANNKTIDFYLRNGRPATHSRDKAHFSGVGRAQPARLYVVGPHKTHKPHEVKQHGAVMSAAGVPTPHTWTVMHPGTLVKEIG